MKALVCRTLEGPRALSWETVDQDPPAAGELQLRVRAAATNFADVLVTRGKYQIRPALPFVPGMEVAGEVVTAGAGVRGFSTGDRVAAVLPEFGGFREFANMDARYAFRIDARLPWEVAACIPSVYGTVWYGLVDLAGVRAGELVLVLGAAGGVGSAALRIAKSRGARTIAVVSDQSKAEAARQAGADFVVDSRGEDVRSALREIARANDGIDVTVDPVGGALTELAVRNSAWGGRHLVVGFASGAIPAVAVNLLLLKGASLIGVNFGGYAMRYPEKARSIYRELVGLLAADASLWPPIECIAMQNGAGALQRVEARTAQGKLVLVND